MSVSLSDYDTPSIVASYIVTDLVGNAAGTFGSTSTSDKDNSCPPGTPPPFIGKC